MSAPAPLLSVFGLKDRAGLLQGISLRAERGQFVLLKGEEAEALRRAARLIAGREKPLSGDVYLGSRKITNDWPDQKKLCYIRGGKKPLFYFRRDRERLSALGIEPAGLEEDERVFASRVARALAQKPALLVIDASGPAPGDALKEKLLQTLKAACLTGLGVLFLDTAPLAQETADEVYLLSGGLILQSGSPQELYEHPRSARAARMSGESILISGRVEALKGNRLLFIAQGLNIPCQSPLWLMPGERVTLFLRPEWLRWCKEKTPQFSPPLTAKLLSAEQGETGWTLRFELPNGLELKLSRAQAEEKLRLPGESYHLWWEKERALLLPPEEEENA